MKWDLPVRVGDGTHNCQTSMSSEQVIANHQRGAPTLLLMSGLRVKGERDEISLVENIPGSHHSSLLRALPDDSSSGLYLRGIRETISAKSNFDDILFMRICPSWGITSTSSPTAIRALSKTCFASLSP